MFPQTLHRPSKIQSLSGFTNLQTLSLEHGDLSDRSFQGLFSLESLILQICHFKNFKNESFRHLSNLEFLYMVEPKNFTLTNFAELKKLKWLKLLYLNNYSIVETLSLNTDLTGLFIRNEGCIIDCQVFRKLIHPNLETLWLELDCLDRLDLKWLAGLPNLKNLLLVGLQEDLLTFKVDLSSLSNLESVYLANIKCRSLNFSNLSKLKRWNLVFLIFNNFFFNF